MRNTFLENQKHSLLQGRLNRREFITAMVATGVALPTAMSLSDSVMAMTPNSGGHFRLGFGHGSTTDSLDPGTTENDMMTGVNFAYGQCLTEVDSDGSLIPELAESYDSTDGKTWVFAIRQGVEFHNGKTLTPDDVIASLRYHMGEDTKSAAKGLLTSVTNLSADGNNVVVELDAPDAGFPFIVSDYHLLILPSKDGQVDALAGIGTGPYKLENFEQGVRAEFTRVANYWKTGRQHFDSLEYLALADATARQGAVMNGDVDVATRIDPKTVALMQRVPTIKILERAGTLHYSFPMRLDVAPFDNHDLRMACKFAINRQELVDKILLGHGVVGNDHPISTANQFHASDLPQREFDPDKVRFHLKKAGMEGATIQLSASDAAFAGAVDAAQLIKASAAQGGLNIDVVREPQDGYWSNVWNKKGWCACYWGGRPTEDWMFKSAYVADTEWNDTAWRDTDGAKLFNALVLQGRSELDENKRRAIYAECQQLISDDGGAIVPMFANHIHALSKKVSTPEQVAGNWEADGHKACERWWFA